MNELHTINPPMTLLLEIMLQRAKFSNLKSLVPLLPWELKKNYFRMEGSTRGEIEPIQGEIETNIGKLRNSEKLKFPFCMVGTFGDI